MPNHQISRYRGVEVWGNKGNGERVRVPRKVFENRRFIKGDSSTLSGNPEPACPIYGSPYVLFRTAPPGLPDRNLPVGRSVEATDSRGNMRKLEVVGLEQEGNGITAVIRTQCVKGSKR